MKMISSLANKINESAYHTEESDRQDLVAAKVLIRHLLVYRQACKDRLDSGNYVPALIGGRSDRDALITFDEPTHIYRIEGQKTNGSVTGLVHKFFSKFDTYLIASLVVKKKTLFTDPESAHYAELLKDLDLSDPADKKKGIKMIQDYWSSTNGEQARLGTVMHKSIEDYYISGRTQLDNTYEFNLFLDFDRTVIESGYLPYRTEQIVFCPDCLLAGSVDMMFIHKDNVNDAVKKIWLVDWKRSKEIKSEGYKRACGTGPLSEKQDCNLEQYSLQLRIYCYLLEKYYELKIVRMTIAVFHPNNSKYMLYEVEHDKKMARKVIAIQKADTLSKQS